MDRRRAERLTWMMLVMEPDDERTLVEWLAEARALLAFCGAGVSAESGVPTFRGAGGLWEGRPVEEVATPEGFQESPQRVWRFYAERMEGLRQVAPNPAHRVLAEMEDRYDPFLLVTQNVDNLHERAGSRKLVKIHGSVMETRCLGCGYIDQRTDPVSSDAVAAGSLPLCRECGSLLRPNVVWFGEYLDRGRFEQISRFFRSAEGKPGVLLIIGTSGVVSGGYGLPELALRSGARVVEINPNPAFEGVADLVYAAPAGELLGRIWPQVKEARRR